MVRHWGTIRTVAWVYECYQQHEKGDRERAAISVCLRGSLFYAAQTPNGLLCLPQVAALMCGDNQEA
jgi:hypothetical protein